MTAHILFYIFIGLLLLDFCLDTFLDYLNAQHFDDKIPSELNDIYDESEYVKSQAYKKERHRFDGFHSTFSIVLLIAFIGFDGFAYVDQFAMHFSDNPIIIALIFFGIIIYASDIINLPFSYYSTFVIEEKYDFNNTTLKTFIADKIKGWLMTALLGGGILTLIVWFYQIVGREFWFYAWAVITIFSIIMNMFYSRLIVPLFNKQTPLEKGELRQKIETYANKVGFVLHNIYSIDGSKRSTKANAYFSGFGREKRITLFDTLVENLDSEEIVAVLAHEVGHYKRHHIIYNLIASIITTGFTLWLLSLFVDSSLLSAALGASSPSFHIGLIAFGILYSPISTLTGLMMNILSRKFEYQADDYAKHTYQADKLISSLKKLSRQSLSNLTPHRLYVSFNYSHPTLLQRIKNLGRH